MLREKDRRIVELEEETAHLEEQCLILADCNTCFSTCKDNNTEMKKQLAEAKEIIRKLYDIVCGRSGDDQELLNRAEQFILKVLKINH